MTRIYINGDLFNGDNIEIHDNFVIVNPFGDNTHCVPYYHLLRIEIMGDVSFGLMLKMIHLSVTKAGSIMLIEKIIEEK